MFIIQYTKMHNVTRSFLDMLYMGRQDSTGTNMGNHISYLRRPKLWIKTRPDSRPRGVASSGEETDQEIRTPDANSEFQGLTCEDLNLNLTGKDEFDDCYDHDCVKHKCQRVTINVSGQRFETQLRTLERFPHTLLGNPEKRLSYWNEARREFFIDRHRPSFQAILYFYQSGGRLRRPLEVPEDVFLEEMQFYELGEELVSKYRKIEGLDSMDEEVRDLPNNKLQRQIWLLLEYPDTSMAARIIAVISVMFILTSIVNFCLETLPVFTRTHCVNKTVVLEDGDTEIRQLPNYMDVFFIIESVCISWFTVEFVFRLFASPDKVAFAKGVMNLFDLVAIVPYFVILISVTTADNCENAKKSGSFIFIRVLRIFRIFKLSKHSSGLRILGLTLKASVRELGLFVLFLIIAMVMFGSALFYAEGDLEDSQVKSIPEAFWWSIITMTTVGYGDVVPVGAWGKLVGAVCAISGVLAIALPLPIIVTNFTNYYRHNRGGGSSGFG